jgi:hypothetical protein
MATSLKPVLATVTTRTPEPDPAKQRCAKGQETELGPLPTQATTEVENTPTASKNDLRHVDVAVVPGPAARDALEGTFGEGVGQAVRAVADVEIKIWGSLNATILAASHFVKELEKKEPIMHPRGGTPPSGRPPQPDFSKKVWYCLAWIGGAVFTSILAPLVVELIKHRIGVGRPQPDRSGSPSSRV